jgi:Fe-Mn family superoxide dismutase
MALTPETHDLSTRYRGTSRRMVLAKSVGLATGLLAAAPIATAQEARPPRDLRVSEAFDTAHDVQPLPFDPASLKNISKRLIESHWSNNYGGSVRALNETNGRLKTALTDRDLPAFVYNDLKREHLLRTGSVILHELYFQNLGGDGQAPAALRSLIAQAFGAFDRWETEFRRIAAGLGGGSGWVLFGYNHQFQTLENYWMADHMHCPAMTVPLLVLDMYEHSYQMDYGAATARYVDAFFVNINWDRVAARVERIDTPPGNVS